MMEFWENESERLRFLHWIEADTAWSVVKDTDLTYLMKREGAYAKAVTFISKGEAKLSEALAARFPELLPKVTAVHPTEPWFIMEEIAGKPLREEPNEAQYKTALQAYARLQQQMSRDVDVMVQMGIPDRRPSILKDEIRRYLPEMCAGLDSAKRAAVLALQEELSMMCEELESGIPMSVDHGDLHGGNIFWQSKTETPCILDWGDATVTHPFFSVRVFWNALFDLLPEEEDRLWMQKIEVMRAVYLQEWRDIAPQEVLERHLTIAEELGCVYRAISWHVYVTKNRRNQKDSSDKPAQWLSLLLEYRELIHDDVGN